MGQTETVQDIGRPGRQGIDHLLNELAEIHLARLDRLIQICGFLQHRRGRQRQRQDHHGHDDHERGEGGKVAMPPHGGEQPPVERRKHDGEHGCPKDRAVERPEDPTERH